jgi:hypothetical protein
MNHDSRHSFSNDFLTHGIDAIGVSHKSLQRTTEQERDRRVAGLQVDGLVVSMRRNLGKRLIAIGTTISGTRPLITIPNPSEQTVLH